MEEPPTYCEPTKPPSLEKEFLMDIINSDRILGPVFLPNHLDAQNYLIFLRGELEDMLDDLPLSIYSSLLFQHDGTPAHFARGVREYLNIRFGRWIGRGGPVPGHGTISRHDTT
ncbi:unnamed protein product [Diatraea saccharalis]|uniref:Transposase n=1 Tax=Diatraea saccharalis TaxID=40085 RepID=A0A9N9WD06_9NEOP|nr:unnamed protein product [Diatraea saccharalis]